MDPVFIMSAITIAALVMSIVIHEVAHGFMANFLGDPTARLAGRLTINPISHIDIVGSIIVPAILYLSHMGILFGWAKPVPYNPYNLKNQRWGEALVAAAGPGTNIIIALIFSGIIRMSPTIGGTAAFVQILGYIVHINILLACFNMIPIPPLDGSKILAAILPYRLEMKYRELTAFLEQNGVLATFIFIFFFVYILQQPFSALVAAVYTLFVGTSL